MYMFKSLPNQMNFVFAAVSIGVAAKPTMPGREGPRRSLNLQDYKKRKGLI